MLASCAVLPIVLVRPHTFTIYEPSRRHLPVAHCEAAHACFTMGGALYEKGTWRKSVNVVP